jgi:hypothetical protein
MDNPYINDYDRHSSKVKKGGQSGDEKAFSNSYVKMVEFNNSHPGNVHIVLPKKKFLA